MMPTLALVLILLILVITVAGTEGESIRGRNQDDITNAPRKLFTWPWEQAWAELQAEVARLEAWALQQVPEAAGEGGGGDGCPSFCLEEREKDKGDCNGVLQYPWGYNSQTERCENFTLPGCVELTGNFETEQECKTACNGCATYKSSVYSPPSPSNNYVSNNYEWWGGAGIGFRE